MSRHRRSSEPGHGRGCAAWMTLVALLAAGSLAAPVVAATTLTAPALLDAAPSTGTLAVAFALPGCTPPACAPVNVEYSLDGGATWTPRSPASTASPLAIAGLVDLRTYLLALRLVDGTGPGAASPSVLVTPGAGITTPGALAIAEMEGDLVTLVWDPPTVGAHPRDYVVEGGLVPGQTLATMAIGSNATVVRVPLADGVYFVRVRALALATTSGPSNEVRVVRGASMPPSPPGPLLGAVDGASLALSWAPTFAGGEPSETWLVVAGPVSGVVPVGTGGTFRADAVPPGTYDLHLVATNVAGASAASPSLTLTVPAPCAAAPGPPLRLRATASGTTITFSWSAPDSGAAVTAYRVMVGTPGDRAPTAMTLDHDGPRYTFVVPVAGRHVSGTLPPDFYSLFVAAVNDCGVGPQAGPVSVDTR